MRKVGAFEFLSLDGDLVGFVRDLKDGPGGDIGVHASISVTQTLLCRRSDRSEA